VHCLHLVIEMPNACSPSISEVRKTAQQDQHHMLYCMEVSKNFTDHQFLEGGCPICLYLLSRWPKSWRKFLVVAFRWIICSTVWSSCFKVKFWFKLRKILRKILSKPK
jgi:hypothetical protein